MSALDVAEEHKIRVAYRSMLNRVIAFDAQAMPGTLETEIRCAKALAQDLERLDQLIRSASNVPRRDYISKMLRWIALNGTEAQKVEAKALLALETRHRHSER
jgi:hypothetical protein